MSTIKKIIKIKDDSKISLKIEPGLATTGTLNVNLFNKKEGIQESVREVDLEEGGVILFIDHEDLSKCFLNCTGKLFPLPGKEEVLVTLTIYDNEVEISSFQVKDKYPKFIVSME